jgi:hypothetical protein
MARKKRQQTINKRNREVAVAEKRALKLQRKQEKREAVRAGEPWPPVAPPEFGEPGTAEPGAEQPEAAQPEAAEPEAAEPEAAAPTPPAAS